MAQGNIARRNLRDKTEHHHKSSLFLYASSCSCSDCRLDDCFFQAQKPHVAAAIMPSCTKPSLPSRPKISMGFAVKSISTSPASKEPLHLSVLTMYVLASCSLPNRASFSLLIMQENSGVVTSSQQLSPDGKYNAVV